MNDLTKKDGDDLKEKTAIHTTVKAMTEGQAHMMADRILALCNLIEQLSYGENSNNTYAKKMFENEKWEMKWTE